MDSTSGRQRSQSDGTVETDGHQPMIVIEPSSDIEDNDDMIFKSEDDASVLEEFKAPEEPRRTRRVTRRKAAAKKESIHNYDPEYSDGTDA